MSRGTGYNDQASSTASEVGEAATAISRTHFPNLVPETRWYRTFSLLSISPCQGPEQQSLASASCSLVVLHWGSEALDLGILGRQRSQVWFQLRVDRNTVRTSYASQNAFYCLQV